MKKFLIVACLVLLCACTFASAANLQSHNFTNFTADVPADAKIDVRMDAVYSNVNSNTLTWSSLKSMSPSSSNTYFFDSTHNISFDIQNNTNEANYTNIAGSDAVDLGKDNGLYCYNVSDSTEKEYVVLKPQDGFLFWPGEKLVVLRGPDLDLLKQIGSTVKFE
jgi:hypothetical protein